MGRRGSNAGENRTVTENAKTKENGDNDDDGGDGDGDLTASTGQFSQTSYKNH
jgi:hypothetical protein